MLEIGVDIGGTFTDVVCLDRRRGRLRLVKVASRPDDLVAGVTQAVARVFSDGNWQPSAVSRFVHGTTVATNTILEQNGARLGLLTTEGFEDILEIGRQKRSRLYDLFLDPETPTFLAPRRFRRGIPERVGSRGEIITPLDEEAVRQTAKDLVEQERVEAIAVVYLFSFRNRAHERRTAEIIREAFPDIPVSLSNEVNPVFREYERTCVTVFDAYIRPRIACYLARLREGLVGVGIPAPPLVIQSRGGLTSAEAAIHRPVSMILSGLAAGVIGAREIGNRAGLPDLITVDMGGTSCDVALISRGKPILSSEGRIGRYPLRVPMVDVNTIGAGGGSIAWIDDAGGLRVGPQSAGAKPGPACYGQGGEAATVTDADLCLGYLNPEYFAGGEITLDVAQATTALERLGRRLKLGIVPTAWGIHSIINGRMADEIRLVSIRRGFDPRRFALVAFGGAGPVHATALAQTIGIPLVLVPPAPGVLSAIGLLVANVEHEQARTLGTRAAQSDLAQIRAIFADLDQAGFAKMARDGVPARAVRLERFADVRYVGQAYELEVPVPTRIGARFLKGLTAAFHRKYAEIYGHANRDAEVEIINLRTVHVWRARGLRGQRPGGTGLRAAAKGQRRAYFPGRGGFAPTPVYERGSLGVGVRLRGPVILEQPDSTILVRPGDVASVDRWGNVLIKVGMA